MAAGLPAEKIGSGVRFCGFCIVVFAQVRFPCAMLNTTSAAIRFAAPALGVNGAQPTQAQTADEVRRQLQRILSCSDFVASERNRRFLQHIVERTLRGEIARGYEIGTLVFGRPKSFNATLDPIVRIEAGKLRRDLETYYLKSGKHDPIRISIPKGSYRTVFSRNEDHVVVADPSRGSQLLLRAAMLGLAGERAEAAAAWRALEAEFPDFALNPHAHKALQALHAHDDRVRELLLEGLQRAARPDDSAPHARGGMQTEGVIAAPRMWRA